MINFQKLAEPPGEVYQCYASISILQQMLFMGEIPEYEFVSSLNALFDCVTWEHYEQLEQGGRI